jgi:hypothetical protein
VPHRDSAEPTRGRAARGLLALLAILLLSQLLAYGAWVGWLAATRGPAGLREAVAEYRQPYAHLYDGAVHRLASALVPPARPGEALTPQVRFERPWPQGLAALVGIGSIALIAWLYRREGGASPTYRALLAGIRVALVLLAMFLLSEAVLSVDRTGLPYFLILADDSASAGVADQYADAKAAATAAALAKAAERPQPTRLAVAEGWLARDDAALLKKLQEKHRVRLYLTSSATRPLAEIDAPERIKPVLEQLEKVEPTGAESRLGDGLRQVLTELRGAPPTAVLLLTDGQTTDGEPLAKAAEFARSKDVPVFPVGLGDPAPARDLALSDLQVDEVAFVDDQVRFEARLGGQGFAGQPIEVALKRRPAGADPKSAEVVDRRPFPAPTDGQQARVELRHRPKETGDYIYTLEIEPRPRELQVENNRVERPVNVREEKLRVLLVDGRPRYEFRYLLSFLKRDKTIDVKTVLQSSDPEYSEQENTALPTFPSATDGPEGLFSYDVVILGDADPELLGTGSMQALADFVAKRGGGLMFLAGEVYNPLAFRNTPLEPLIPVKLAEARNPSAAGGAIAGYRPALSVEGRNHPIFRFTDDEAQNAKILAELPELSWYLEAPRKQELAFVLAAHPTLAGTDGPLPILLYQFVGSGKVMLQGFDDTWKWRFRVGDKYFGRYWIQTIRFLARSRLLGAKGAEITTDRRRYARQDPIRVQVRFVNPGLAPSGGRVNVQVERPGQGPRQLALRRSSSAQNLFEGALPPLGEGEYSVRLLPPPILEGGLPATTFRIDPPAGEFERVQMNEPELLRVAKLTGGRFLTPGTPLDELLGALPAPQMVPLETDPPIALWNTWPVLGLFLGLLAAEWILRKRKQMV